MPELGRIYLHWLDTMYQGHKSEEPFFNSNNFFNLLSGNTLLQTQIKAGMSVKNIRASWQEELNSYMKMREKYLLYPDF